MGIILIVFIEDGGVFVGFVFFVAEELSEVATEDKLGDAIVPEDGVALVVGNGCSWGWGEERTEYGIGNQLLESLFQGGLIALEEFGKDAEIGLHRLIDIVEDCLPVCIIAVGGFLAVCNIGRMAGTRDSELLLIVGEELAQGLAGIFFWFFCLKIAYHLVDGSPCFNGIGWCLSFYLHIELTDVGDAEAAVVAETNKEMAIFLAFVFYLLYYTNPTCHGSAEDTDGIILLDKVAVSFVDNA